MDSTLFFKDKDINSIYKDKSGLYVIEQPLFSRELGYPVYKIGYAKHSLYTRISHYRTAYGLIPFKIHALYTVPNGVRNKRVNYAYLQERVAQVTLLKLGKWVLIGEWFKDLDTIMSVLYSMRQKHLEEIKSSIKWNFWTLKSWTLRDNKITKIKLEPEENIKGQFKELDWRGGVQTRNMNEDESDDTFQQNAQQILKTK